MGKPCASNVAKKPSGPMRAKAKPKPKQLRQVRGPGLPRRRAAVAAAAAAATPDMQTGSLAGLVGMMATEDAGDGPSAEASTWANGRGESVRINSFTLHRQISLFAFRIKLEDASHHFSKSSPWFPSLPPLSLHIFPSPFPLNSGNLNSIPAIWRNSGNLRKFEMSRAGTPSGNLSFKFPAI